MMFLAENGKKDVGSGWRRYWIFVEGDVGDVVMGAK